jgi:hypothetical protein
MPEEKREYPITATRSEYKGNQLIVLSSGTNERYPFSFGLQKAKRILACIPDIQKFVAETEALEAAKPKTVQVK